MKNKLDRTIQTFESIEKDLKLDESIISGVPWWDCLRYPLFNELITKLKMREERKNYSFKLKSYQIIIELIINFKNAIKFFSPKSPLWMKKYSKVILGHPRRKFDGNFYIDIYSDPFVDLFPNPNNFSIIEQQGGSGHLSPVKSKNIFHIDSLFHISSIISKFRYFKFSKNEIVILNILEKRLFEEFGLKIDIVERAKKVIKNWLGTYPLMKLFFKLKKPKCLFIIVSSSQEAIISAAKSINIPTIELQHGSPARGKLNYDYSSGIRKSSFPNWFLSFGEYWQKDCKFPIENNNIISFGFPYLNSQKIQYSKILKENRMVVISQPVIAKKLTEFAIQISEKFSNKVIVEYKPHPAEYSDEESDYFKKLRDSKVQISKKNANLYSIFAKSRWSIGVYSTAIYEGLYFGVSPFILKIDGYEYMKKFIDSGYAKLITSTIEIDLDWKINQKDVYKIFSKTSNKQIKLVESLTKKYN